MDTTYALNTDTLDYTIDELDDVADRKVGPIPVGGDEMARLVRARRGTAHVLGQVYPDASSWAEYSVWGSLARGGDRRMLAVGQIDPAWGMLGWGESYVSEDGDVFRWYPLVSDAGPTIVRGPNY